MEITSLGQLEQLLRAEVQAAMQSASDNIHSEIENNHILYYVISQKKARSRYTYDLDAFLVNMRTNNSIEKTRKLEDKK